MFRARILVKTGCLRCRKRKKKCDETKPVCGYCGRWQLDCDWPKASANHPQSGSQYCAENDFSVRLQQKNRTPSPNSVTAVLEQFQELPISDAVQRSDVAGYLQFFLSSMVEGALPFQIVSTRGRLANGWVQSAFADSAVCYAFAAYCARLQSRSSLVDRQKRHSLEYERLALATLRQRLDSRARPTEHTILVAALHFAMLAFGDLDAKELARVAAGINAMVLAYGGYERMLRTMQLSTILSIEICDMFCTFLNGTPPMMKYIKRPHPPMSLKEFCVSPLGSAGLEKCCEPSVVSVMEDLHFLLYFRSPSRQTRSFTTEESFYVYSLFQFCENQLGILQAQHAGRGTLCEVLVMAMVVLKRETIPLDAQHVSLTTAILHRLYTAIAMHLTIHVKQDKVQRKVLIWACLVALVGPGLEKVRIEFRDTMVQVIQLRFGSESWPPGWDVDILRELRSFLWHARLEQRFLRLCDELNSRMRVGVSDTSSSASLRDTRLTDKPQSSEHQQASAMT